MDTRAREDGEREARSRRGLERLRTIARLFDQAFGIPGTRWRFGIDALFGLVPGLGNVALDALIGTVPLIGDLFDFVFKAQTRNLALLEEWINSPHETQRRSRRGMILLPLTILLVFITLTVTGIWVLYLVVRWLATSAGG